LRGRLAGRHHRLRRLRKYEQNQDFEIDLTAGRSDFIPLRWPPQAKTVHVQVTEYFLAYQCSTNNMGLEPGGTVRRRQFEVRKNYFRSR